MSDVIATFVCTISGSVISQSAERVIVIVLICLSAVSEALSIASPVLYVKTYSPTGQFVSFSDINVTVPSVAISKKSSEMFGLAWFVDSFTIPISSSLISEVDVPTLNVGSGQESKTSSAKSTGTTCGVSEINGKSMFSSEL